MSGTDSEILGFAKQVKAMRKSRAEFERRGTWQLHEATLKMEADVDAECERILSAQKNLFTF